MYARVSLLKILCRGMGTRTLRFQSDERGGRPGLPLDRDQGNQLPASGLASMSTLVPST